MLFIFVCMFVCMFIFINPFLSLEMLYILLSINFASSDGHLFLKLSNTWKFSNINEIVKFVVKKRFREKDANFFMNELKKLIEIYGDYVEKYMYAILKIKNKIYFYCCIVYISLFFI